MSQSRFTILMCAIGSLHEELANLGGPLWVEYCKRFGGQFIPSVRRVVDGTPHWEKWAFLNEYLWNVPAGALVCVMDPDMLPRLLVDPESVDGPLQLDADVGAVFVEPARFYNSGAVWVRKSARACEFVERVLRGGPLPDGRMGGFDQGRMNQEFGVPFPWVGAFPAENAVNVLSNGLRVQRVAARWNKHRWTPSRTTVWEGFHGTPDKATLRPIFEAARDEWREGRGIWQR